MLVLKPCTFCNGRTCSLELGVQLLHNMHYCKHKRYKLIRFAIQEWRNRRAEQQRKRISSTAKLFDGAQV